MAAAIEADENYDDKLKKRIKRIFVFYVEPREFLIHMPQFGLDVSNVAEQYVKKERSRYGQQLGAEKLLSTLVRYNKNWFEKTLRVLQCREMNQVHVAEKLQKLKDNLDAELCRNPQLELPTASVYSPELTKISQTNCSSPLACTQTDDDTPESDFKLLPHNLSCSSELQLQADAVPEKDITAAQDNVFEAGAASSPPLTLKDLQDMSITKKKPSTYEAGQARRPCPKSFQSEDLTIRAGPPLPPRPKSFQSEDLIIRAGQVNSEQSLQEDSPVFPDAKPIQATGSLQGQQGSQNQSKDQECEGKAKETDERGEFSQTVRQESSEMQCESIQGAEAEEDLYEQIGDEKRQQGKNAESSRGADKFAKEVKDERSELDQNVRWGSQKMQRGKVQGAEAQKGVYYDCQSCTEESAPPTSRQERTLLKPSHEQIYDFSRQETTEALKNFPGWNEYMTEQMVFDQLTPLRHEDGHYVIWYWENQKQPAISVTYQNNIKNFLIHKHPDKEKPGVIKFYYILVRQHRNPSVLELVSYHLSNGLRDPDSTQNSKPYSYIYLSKPVL